MAFKLQFVTVQPGQNQRTVLESLILDASISEMHEADADVTEFPVEQGADITDNVRVKPQGLQVEAIISDFHLSNPNRDGGAVTGAFKAGWQSTGKLQDAVDAKTTLAKLEDYHSKGTLIDVETGLKSYRNMVIKSLRTPRDKNTAIGNTKTAGSLRVTIILQTIIVVSSQNVVIKTVPKGQPVVAKGAKTSKGANAGQVQEAKSIAKEVGAFFRKATGR